MSLSSLFPFSLSERIPRDYFPYNASSSLSKKIQGVSLTALTEAVALAILGGVGSYVIVTSSASMGFTPAEMSATIILTTTIEGTIVGLVHGLYAGINKAR